ncbi:MAG: hypothetical protein WDZ85_00010 [Candidatus Paceibacterota bacterium]
MRIKDLKLYGRREAAIHRCFDKLPIELRKEVEENIDFLFLNSTSHTEYSLDKPDALNILIVINDVDDLSNSALRGLIAHLFALVHIKYHKSGILNGEEWLKIDLYSDDVAKDWGFKEEVEEIRKIRPQKIPEEVTYPNLVINHSASRKKFDADIQSILSKQNILTRNDKRIWYVDRFSMICDIQNLSKLGINHLHILTDKYTYNELRKIINN